MLAATRTLGCSFRIFLGVAGAALVILPLGAWSSYAPAIAGLVLFVSAILLPPAKPVTNVDDKVRELGALVVVNGGRFKLGDAASFAAQLFVGAEDISVRDSRLQSFLEIPVSEITSAQVKESHGRWFLRIDWADKTAAFAYDSVFAEHLARVAETTIRKVMRPRSPRSIPTPRRWRLILVSPLFCTDSRTTRAICVTLYLWHAAGKARTSNRRSKRRKPQSRNKVLDPRPRSNSCARKHSRIFSYRAFAS